MPINVEQDAVDRIWTLLEGRAGFTSAVIPGNRIKTEEKSWGMRDSSRTQSADSPNVRVYVTANNTNKPTMLLDYTDVDYPIEGRLDIEIRTRFEFQSDDKQMPLEAEIDAAILGAGIDLGLPWVRWATTRKTRRTQQVEGSTDRYRTTVTQTISLETSIMSSEFA